MTMLYFVQRVMVCNGPTDGDCDTSHDCCVLYFIQRDEVCSGPTDCGRDRHQHVLCRRLRTKVAVALGCIPGLLCRCSPVPGLCPLSGE